jgi:hypothetical protein
VRISLLFAALATPAAAGPIAHDVPSCGDRVAWLEVESRTGDQVLLTAQPSPDELAAAIAGEPWCQQQAARAPDRCFGPGPIVVAHTAFGLFPGDFVLARFSPPAGLACASRGQARWLWPVPTALAELLGADRRSGRRRR